jgi:D-lactate dehydrogenase (cytochrome)
MVSGNVVRGRAAVGDATACEPITDAQRLTTHLDDAAHVPGGYAKALVEPRSERDVVDAVRAAERILAIGAQSSLTGGATPRGETLLSTARLRRIVDMEDGRLRVGAGVTLAEIDAHLARRGALYPPLPTWYGATIGGAAATNAAGAATFKYGSTRQWIDELTVVLASGDVVDLRRGEARSVDGDGFNFEVAGKQVLVPVPRYRMPDVPKVSAGYFAAPAMDAVDLFIGSEGTLGVITEVTLRVLPVRPAVCLVFAALRNRRAAVDLVARLRTEALQAWRSSADEGVDVSAIEHMDARSLAIVREDGVDKRVGVALDPAASIGLLIAVDLPPGTTAAESYDAFSDGAGAAGNGRALGRLESILQAHGVSDALIAPPGDRAAFERLLVLREAVPLGVNHRIGRAQREIDPRIQKTAADVIVPFDRFDEMLALFDDELRKRGLDGAVWGHISDGNVHPNIIPRSFAEMESGRDAILACGRASIRLGGSPLAEHGVGRSETKQQLLRELYGEDGIEQMRAVKRALDPDGKLAPGVIFSG